MQVPKHTKPALSKPIVRFYLTLNNTPELIKPELPFLTRITPNLSLQSCPPSIANTMLGICYTCVALCCSAHGCYAVECDVACCAAQHTAIVTLTPSDYHKQAHDKLFVCGEKGPVTKYIDRTKCL